jgi:hypothetical protein
MKRFSPQTDVLLQTLLQREAHEPGSVVLRVGTRKETVIVIGRDCWDDLAMTEVARHEI